MRAFLFESLYTVADPQYDKDAINTFATKLREQMESLIKQARESANQSSVSVESNTPAEIIEVPASDQMDDEPPDLEIYYQQLAYQAVNQNTELLDQFQNDGAAWGYVNSVIAGVLPETLDGRDQKAYHLVAPTLDLVLGNREQGGWHTFKRERGSKRVTYIKAGTAK